MNAETCASMSHFYIEKQAGASPPEKINFFNLGFHYCYSYQVLITQLNARLIHMMSYMYRLLSTLVERLFYYISFVIFCLAHFKLISKVILFQLVLRRFFYLWFRHNHFRHHSCYIQLPKVRNRYLLKVLLLL